MKFSEKVVAAISCSSGLTKYWDSCSPTKKRALETEWDEAEAERLVAISKTINDAMKAEDEKLKQAQKPFPVKRVPRYKKTKTKPSYDGN